jgi:hypothetical protein
MVVAGCASNEEWATWKQHPTHFASGDHGFFSIRNRDDSAKRVTRQDIALARDRPGLVGPSHHRLPGTDPGALMPEWRRPVSGSHQFGRRLAGHPAK